MKIKKSEIVSALRECKDLSHRIFGAYSFICTSGGGETFRAAVSIFAKAYNRWQELVSRAGIPTRYALEGYLCLCGLEPIQGEESISISYCSSMNESIDDAILDYADSLGIQLDLHLNVSELLGELIESLPDEKESECFEKVVENLVAQENEQFELNSEMQQRVRSELTRTILLVLEHGDTLLDKTEMKAHQDAHRIKKIGWNGDTTRICPAVVKFGNEIVELLSKNPDEKINLAKLGREIRAENKGIARADDLAKNLRKHISDGRFVMPKKEEKSAL